MGMQPKLAFGSLRADSFPQADGLEFLHTYEFEKMAGFWRGYGPRNVRVHPALCDDLQQWVPPDGLWKAEVPERFLYCQGPVWKGVSRPRGTRARDFALLNGS